MGIYTISTLSDGKGWAMMAPPRSGGKDRKAMVLRGEDMAPVSPARLLGLFESRRLFLSWTGKEAST